MKYQYPKSNETNCQICKCRNIDHTQIFDKNRGNLYNTRLDFIYDTKVGHFCTTCINEKELTDANFGLGIISEKAKPKVAEPGFFTTKLGAAIIDSKRILSAEI